MAFAVAVLAWPGLRAQGQVRVGPELRIEQPRLSMLDLRDRNLVRQRFDFSCGAAALATLMRYGYADEISEQDILGDLFSLLSEEEQPEVRSEGFSLLHLQRVAQAHGYRAEGFRLDPGQLAMLGAPVIVYIEPRGYRHFAVLRGVRGDRVYLADPSRGNIRMPDYAFYDSWLQADGTGIIFVVEPATGLPEETMPLALADITRRPPELLSALELLAVGPLAPRLPNRSR